MMRENTVKIDITGLMSERFLNVAGQSGAVFVGVVRKKDCVSATVSVKHLRHLRKAARLSRCKVRVYGRRGPGFAAAGVIRRFMLPVGFLIVTLAIIFVTRYTWILNVEGNSKLSDEQVAQMRQQIRRESV